MTSVRSKYPPLSTILIGIGGCGRVAFVVLHPLLQLHLRTRKIITYKEFLHEIGYPREQKAI